MKILALALLLAPSISLASTVSYTDDSVGFSCSSIYAVEALIKECEAQGKKLVEYGVSSCRSNGDDGGYVNYFSVTVSGTCQ